MLHLRGCTCFFKGPSKFSTFCKVFGLLVFFWSLWHWSRKKKQVPELWLDCFGTFAYLVSKFLTFLLRPVLASVFNDARRVLNIPQDFFEDFVSLPGMFPSNNLSIDGSSLEIARSCRRNPVVEGTEKKLDPPIVLAEMDEKSWSEHQSVTGSFRGRWHFVPSLLLSHTISHWLQLKIDEAHFHDDDIWLQLPEFILFLLSYFNMSIPLRIKKKTLALRDGPLEITGGGVTIPPKKFLRGKLV